MVTVVLGKQSVLSCVAENMGLKIYLIFWVISTCFVTGISFSKYDQYIVSSCLILKTLM